jgi:recombination protein RecR
MTKYPQAFEELIEALKSLPGIGRRSAERMAFAMLKWPSEKIAATGNLIASLNLKIGHCPQCGNISSSNQPCEICADFSRDQSTICVVEESAQIESIEKCGAYKGVYHVMNGKIIPLDAKDIETASFEKLKQRADSGGVKELVMAFSMDIEGQATSIYLADIFKNSGIKISRIARGLPAGSDIAFADSATITAAFQGRTPIV